ncbi:T9SS type A sorting domain-containing protein [candidate division KSB1 bacterium]|nr:T9SS type A sorting domain-containing protein [candidate division KSB1 bacterium]
MKIKVLCWFLIFMFLHSIVPAMETDSAKINGAFKISVRTSDEWKQVGQLSYGQDFETRSLNLGAINLSGPVEIKIEHQNEQAAQIDALFLNNQSVLAVNGKSDITLLKKLQNSDYDVIDAGQRETIFTFQKNENKAVLRMRARIEPENLSTNAFFFPQENVYKMTGEHSTFYAYKLGSREGALAIDGDLQNESLGIPLFKTFARCGSGHPANDVYGWVCNDSENLYVALDFLNDNTYDGDKDYGKVFIKSGKEIREYKVSVPEQKWGSPGYVYTARAPYQHKVYEFMIPFDEAGIKSDEIVNLAFALYGTASFPIPNTIDNFNASDGSAYFIYQNTSAGNSYADTDILWGERDFYGTQTGAGTSNIAVNYSSSGKFVLTVAAGVNFTGNVTWDGIDDDYEALNVGSNWIDLHNYDRFVLYGVQNSGASPITLTLKAYGGTAGNYFSKSTVIAASSGPANIELPYSGFSQTGTPKWDAISTIRIEFSNGDGAVLSINEAGVLDQPLPVDLVHFAADVRKEGVLLNWISATEVDNLGYHVYRASGSDEDFIRISGLIPGAGSSSEERRYSFLDERVETNSVYRYKISCISSATGEESFKSEILVSTSDMDQKITGFALMNNYPNPFNPQTTIKFTLKESRKVNLSVFNMKGQLVTTLIDKELDAGLFKAVWDAGDQPAGTYIYRITAGDFTDMKKMVLIK